MKNSYIALSFIAIVATVAIVISGCKKINESTDLGGGLIPPVDNITTFDTTLTVQAFNDTFGLATDSQYLSKEEEFFLGKINSDPIFGRTDGRIFLELKPPSYPFSFLNKKDSLYIDSVVLVLRYVETYGDSTVPQTVDVYELDQSNNFRSDTSYLIRQNYFTHTTNPTPLGSRTFLPSVLVDSVQAYQDTTQGQLRIRLANSFGTRLLQYDSSSSPIPGAYSSDSIFRTMFKGFALESRNSGNAVMGFDLDNANTKLAIYYRYNKGGPGIVDTTVTYFPFSPTYCAAANYVNRDYTGTPLQSALGGSTPDPVVYIQNTPGSFATIKIPALATLSNRTIHRAELIVEQLYDVSDTLFPPPASLYLDASDPTITASNYKFRTIPYDLSLNTTGTLNLGPFGVVPVNDFDASGHTIKVWKINISRYVQHILTHTQSLYDLRLFAPFSLNEQYGIPPNADISTTVFVNPTIVKGRIRVSGNTGPGDANPYRMRLHIVYSKL